MNNSYLRIERRFSTGGLHKLEARKVDGTRVSISTIRVRELGHMSTAGGEKGGSLRLHKVPAVTLAHDLDKRD